MGLPFSQREVEIIENILSIAGLLNVPLWLKRWAGLLRSNIDVCPKVGDNKNGKFVHSREKSRLALFDVVALFCRIQILLAVKLCE